MGVKQILGKQNSTFLSAEKIGLLLKRWQVLNN